MDKIKPFLEDIKDELWIYLQNNINIIGKENNNYNKYLQTIEDELMKHPNLRKVLEEEEAVELTKEDSEALIEIYIAFLHKREYEIIQSFYLGGKNLFYYFNKMNVFDDEKRT